MHDPELEATVALAKSADATSKPREFYYGEIRKFANRRRGPNESIESAVAKFIQDPIDGVPLYRAMKAAKATYPEPAPAAAVVAKSDDAVHPGLKKLHEIAAQLREEDPLLSKQQSVARAILTPEGMRAAFAERQDRLAKAAQFAGV